MMRNALVRPCAPRMPPSAFTECTEAQKSTGARSGPAGRQLRQQAVPAARRCSLREQALTGASGSLVGIPHQEGPISSGPIGGPFRRSQQQGQGQAKRGRLVVSARIQVDRKLHLEKSFLRQQEAERAAKEALVTCPVDCVQEVTNLPDFEKALRDAEANGELVIVDFYNSACGACKYILPQIIKMCKRGCGEQCDVDGHQGSVKYLKHNVRDEYDDLTDVARFYRIKMVPMFTFFMDGCRVEQMATRDRNRLAATIGRLLQRYNEVSPQGTSGPDIHKQ